MDKDRRKHLDYIQAIITRMNANSFQIKNMTVIILTAILALFAATPKVLLLFIAGFSAFIFWLLDAYYLQQERKFRKMYYDVADITNNHEIKPYEMPVDKYKGNGCSFGESFFSKTIVLFYFSLVLVTTIITIMFLLIWEIPVI